MFKLEVDVWLAAKERILKQLAVLTDQERIPVESICLGGSAAMVLMSIRNEARDVNVWVDSPYFERLAEDHKVLVHPLRDSVVHIPDTEVYVRRRNRYFQSHTLDNGIDVFDELTLLILKRTSYIDPHRSLEQREKDFRDIQILNDLLAVRNKVAP
jgi:hypothetical protein